MPYSLTYSPVYDSTTKLQPEQLSRIEHFEIMPITPSMQSVGFISSRDLVIGRKHGLMRAPSSMSFLESREIVGIGSFEESPLVGSLASGAKILHGEQSMTWRTVCRVPIRADPTALRTGATVPSSRPCNAQDSTA
jgi:hypothetical protein